MPPGPGSVKNGELRVSHTEGTEDTEEKMEVTRVFPWHPAALQAISVRAGRRARSRFA
jgi:hypothetical protein